MVNCASVATEGAARVESSSLELYRVAYEDGEANGKKMLVLVGKDQQKKREGKKNDLIIK